MQTVTVTVELMQKVLNNLAAQPYGQVAPLIDELAKQTQPQAAPLIDAPEDQADDGGDAVEAQPSN